MSELLLRPGMTVRLIEFKPGFQVGADHQVRYVSTRLASLSGRIVTVDADGRDVFYIRELLYAVPKFLINYVIPTYTLVPCSQEPLMVVSSTLMGRPRNQSITRIEVSF